MDDLSSLLKLVKQGDESSFAILCEEYRNLTENAVRRFLPSFGEVENAKSDLYGADDLRQYAAIALYKAAVSYDEEGSGKKVSFGLYAKICINNAMISQLRKYRSELRRRDAAKQADRAERAGKHSSDPFHQLTSREGADVLLEKIRESLSRYEKEIFEFYIDGKSVGEIAERLGKDNKSVSNALYRMKVKVKGLLKN